MEPLPQVIDNVKESFKLAKRDIIELAQTVNTLNETLHEMNKKYQELLKEQHAMKLKLSEKGSKKIIISTTGKRQYVGSRRALKVHDSNCVFAKNIKPKYKINFTSKSKALNQGYKLCDCLKK
ncbi:hypothetical protein C4573_06260 [Candidatus Woesearchaeota archaeon]|nr:MAG: hypothetical protein C4573_06260 [Candidatus Woesearchaeota archaeon]